MSYIHNLRNAYHRSGDKVLKIFCKILQHQISEEVITPAKLDHDEDVPIVSAI